ncbi:hypothetical protein [Prosthecobacter sp.]|uniref:hypothetical protein n=1 Tax=Prosthecobacter sp. TaxID=1965333 RepID=UPI0037846A53
MKRLLLIPLLSLTLHADPTVHHPADWELGTTFPDQPQLSEKESLMADGRKLVESRAILEQNDESYLMECVMLPWAPVGPQRATAYDAGLAAMLRTNPRTLRSQEKILICGHDGRRYLIESKDGTRITDHRVVFIGSKLFVFACERPSKAANSPAADTFFAKITGKTPAQKAGKKD